MSNVVSCYVMTLKTTPIYEKLLFLCAPHPQKTFFNYSQSLLPDWWINIPPASSYWQAPSLITKRTHNSVSICCRDNNGSGLLNSPHIRFLLLSVILHLLPPSLHLEVFSFFSVTLRVFFFFPSSSHEAEQRSQTSDGFGPTERINVQHSRDQALSRASDWLVCPFDEMPAENIYKYME